MKMTKDDLKNVLKVEVALEDLNDGLSKKVEYGLEKGWRWSWRRFEDGFDFAFKWMRLG